MENGLKELLENEVLSEETKTAFLEAWNNKVNEVKASLREEVETTVRNEFANRYEQDRTSLVEAMDNMLSDAVTSHAQETFEATKALKEERQKLTNAIKETRAAYRTRVEQHTKTLESFVLAQLKHQMLSLNESKVKVAKKLREHRIELNTQAAQRVNKLESFVIGQLKKEINEFKQDKDSLVEMKIKLSTEAKAKLAEAKKAFIDRASKIVETTVDAALKKEMGQLKEDIRVARENMFGRRLFESFQAEFMTSYLSEGTQLKKVTTKLAEAESKLEETTLKLSNSKALMEQAQRRVVMSEERALRIKTMNDILSPLNKNKRDVMENLLENVKTQHLKEAFKRYLPKVLNETVKEQDKTRQVVTEARPIENKARVAITGDRTRVMESAVAEELDHSAEIIDLRRLAGIEK
jgi:hypothetical protein